MQSTPNWGSDRLSVPGQSRILRRHAVQTKPIFVVSDPKLLFSSQGLDVKLPVAYRSRERHSPATSQHTTICAVCQYRHIHFHQALLINGQCQSKFSTNSRLPPSLEAQRQPLLKQLRRLLYCKHLCAMQHGQLSSSADDIHKGQTSIWLQASLVSRWLGTTMKGRCPT